MFDNTTNLSVYMLEQGYAILHTPQVEEDLSKYFEELRVADTKAREMKKNVHSNENRKAPHFNDLSGGKGKKIDSQKCKNMFAFLKDEPHLTGIIEIVLNGSRFKIRLNHQPVMIIAVLEGVRCLPNESEFAKASE